MNIGCYKIILYQCFIKINLFFVAVEYSVQCSQDEMNVYVWGEEVFGIQLDKWGQLKECQSQKLPDSHHIQLLLNDDLPCGTTRVRNKITVSFLKTNILNFLNVLNK